MTATLPSPKDIRQPEGAVSLPAASCSPSRSKYKTILADPPWKQTLDGNWKRRPNRATRLPYPTMTVYEICALPIGELGDAGTHLWLWTTNELYETFSNKSKAPTGVVSSNLFGVGRGTAKMGLRESNGAQI